MDGDEVFCPYCGKMQRYEFDDPMGKYDDGEIVDEVECEKCGKRFGIRCSTTTNWYGEELEEEDK